MALINIIKYDGPPAQAPWLTYKFPSDSLVLGSQLIVNRSQEAVFFKGGNALDVFGPGTHTLTTANLPLLGKLANLPFGGRTPFAAEIYFINKTVKLDLKWGTAASFPVVEPRYGVIVNVRAYGQFGIKVADARNFTAQIIGVQHGGEVNDHDVIHRYFKGLVVSKVKSAIAYMIVDQGVSILEITTHLDKISTVCYEKVAAEFDHFGLEVSNFFVESISVADEDLARVKGTLEDRAEFNLLGDERYTRKRSFDVLQTGAANESGSSASAAMGAGLGIGLGFGAGSVAGELARHVSVTPPAEATCSTITCAKCETVNSAKANFCGECGTSLTARKCPGCGHENPPNAKFCGHCGKSMEGSA